MTKTLKIIMFLMAAALGYSGAEIRSLHKQLAYQKQVIELTHKIEGLETNYGQMQAVIMDTYRRSQENSQKIFWLKRGKIVKVEIINDEN